MTEETPGNSVYGYMTEAQLREYYECLLIVTKQSSDRKTQMSAQSPERTWAASNRMF
jgi:hypothetical protein